MSQRTTHFSVCRLLLFTPWPYLTAHCPEILSDSHLTQPVGSKTFLQTLLSQFLLPMYTQTNIYVSSIFLAYRIKIGSKSRSQYFRGFSLHGSCCMHGKEHAEWLLQRWLEQAGGNGEGHTCRNRGCGREVCSL